MCTSSHFSLIGRSLITVIFFCGVLGVSQAQARPEYFRYTSIADTSQHFFSHLNFPCLNDLSRIAFTGTLSSGVEGAFSRVNLSGFNTLADSGVTDYQDFGLDCSINHNAMIEFTALKKVSDGYDTVILRGTGNSASPLTDSTGTYDQFSGFQLNLVGKSVLGAERAADGANVIVVKGAGTLNGPERVIAPGSGAISFYSNYARNPVINSSGTVAFTAIKNRNHTAHILTVDESGLVTEFLSDEGPFVSVGDVVIDDTGSLAFHGVLAGGERGVWRLDQVNDQWVLTQLASSSTTPCFTFSAVAMNDLDAVVFACRDFNSASYVYLSDKQGLHLVLGPGSQLFGRVVAQADIGREAVNSDKQIAMLVDFYDNSSAVVRADPTFIPPWLGPIVSGGLQLETSSDNGGAGISTPIHVRPKLLLLSFDLTFPNSTTGKLHVMLGDKLLKSIVAGRGRHQHVVIPVELRKDSRGSNEWTESLRFEMTGKAGAAVQISNVLIPGIISDAMRNDAAVRWHVDVSKGGFAQFVDTTPFPVEVRILPATKQAKALATHSVTAAILSSKGFDATHDIDISTLAFDGKLLEPGKNPAGRPSSCASRDVNADKLPDLVCEVMVASAERSALPVHVDATSIHGWTISGSSAEAAGASAESTR